MRFVILTCEHGGNEIPQAYREVFHEQAAVLQTHRGWDIGALSLAKLLSVSLEVPLYYATTSRLLVELNRSLHHPHLFSAFTEPLSFSDKKHILKQFYHPYRTKVEAVIRNHMQKNGKVIHISVHSFTPVLEGIERKADIGLLYDPATEEKAFCQSWKSQIAAISDMRVRFNYPYRGTADGFTTYLRKQFPRGYNGIELEVNQRLLADEDSIKRVGQVLTASLKLMI